MNYISLALRQSMQSLVCFVYRTENELYDPYNIYKFIFGLVIRNLLILNRRKNVKTASSLLLLHFLSLSIPFKADKEIFFLRSYFFQFFYLLIPIWLCFIFGYRTSKIRKQENNKNIFKKAIISLWHYTHIFSAVFLT